MIDYLKKDYNKTVERWSYIGKDRGTNAWLGVASGISGIAAMFAGALLENVYLSAGVLPAFLSAKAFFDAGDVRFRRDLSKKVGDLMEIADKHITALPEHLTIQ